LGEQKGIWNTKLHIEATWCSLQRHSLIRLSYGVWYTLGVQSEMQLAV